jgi:hypothetical protein
MQPALLELTLRRWLDGAYAVQPRLLLPGVAADSYLIPGEPPIARFDLIALLECSSEPEVYGKTLTAMLTADRRVGEALATARIQAEALGAPLQLRIRIEASDSTLHSLRWETLYDFARQDFCAASERVLLSRYLDSASTHLAARNLQGRPRALVVIAAPRGLNQYGLAAIDVEVEIERARRALEGFDIELLGSSASVQATLPTITDRLREQPDLLYLIAHGVIRNATPYLWLEDQDGAAVRVPGDALAHGIARLTVRPRMVLLLSCQSQ